MGGGGGNNICILQGRVQKVVDDGLVMGAWAWAWAWKMMMIGIVRFLFDKYRSGLDINR